MTAAAPVYVYRIDDSVTGAPLGEVPLSGVSYSWGLNGDGGFQATINVEDPKARLLQTLSRDITVLRDGVPVFSGPIIGLQGQFASRTLQITAATPWWWMSRRTMELSLDFANTDMATIFDQILSTVNGKFAGDVRLSKIGAYNSTGQSYSISYPASSRKLAGDAINDLAQVYPGFDWFISLRLDTTTNKCIREYQIYGGFKGQTVDQALTQFNITDMQLTDDGSRVFNRVHEMGAGGSDTQFVVSRSSYEGAPTFDFANSLTGWTLNTVSGNPSCDPLIGYAPPSFKNSSGSYQYKSIPHGVGSTIEFDIYSDSTASTVGAPNGTYISFGCNSTGGGGSAFCPTSGPTAPTVTIVPTTSAWSTAASSGTIVKGNLNALMPGAWMHVTVQIDTSTTARLFVGDDQIYRYNSGSGAYDIATWPINLAGTYIGIWDSGTSGSTYIDNIYVSQATSTYVQPPIPYAEKVISRTDIGDVPTLNLYATADLYLGAWPSKTYSVSFRPSASLPYGYATPGDTIPLDVNLGWIAVTGTKRVITTTVAIDDGGNEVVSFAFNDTHA